MSLTPLTHEYFDRCEEIAYNSVKTFDRTFLINLKKGPDDLKFFKFSEKSHGRRTNMYFGATKDTDNFLKCLKEAPKAKEEQVFASINSDTFPARSITMQRILDDYVLIVEEDLDSDSETEDIFIAIPIKRCNESLVRKVNHQKFSNR